MKDNVLIIIPAFNPDENLKNVVDKLIQKNFKNIIVVDDGSKNYKPFEEIKDKAIILKHNKNKGKGEALKTAFKYCANNEKTANVVITVDSDGQHDVEDVEKMWEISDKNKDKVILGIRNFKQAPICSKIGNAIINKKICKKTKIKFKDTQTGLRAIPIKYLKDLIKIPGERYEYETNVLLYFAENKIEIIENEIKTIYIDKNKNSSFRKIKDSIKVYKTIKRNQNAL